MDVTGFLTRFNDTLLWNVARYLGKVEAVGSYLLPAKLHIAMPRHDLDSYGQRVFDTRHELLKSSLSVETLSAARRNDGKLLTFFFDETFASDGVASLITEGYFDHFAFPLPDTWVHVELTAFAHILAWVPNFLVDLVQEAMEVNADESLCWAIDTQFEHLPYKAFLAENCLI